MKNHTVFALMSLAAIAGCTTDSQAPSAGRIDESVPEVARQACLSAVGRQTTGRLVVLSSEYSEANSLVMVGVGDNQAPWRCLVSNSGVVAELTFAGDEGAL